MIVTYLVINIMSAQTREAILCLNTGGYIIDLFVRIIIFIFNCHFVARRHAAKVISLIFEEVSSKFRIYPLFWFLESINL